MTMLILTAFTKKWMELGWQTPILDLDSSFLDWERSVVTGHPTHPVGFTSFPPHGNVAKCVQVPSNMYC